MGEAYILQWKAHKKNTNRKNNLKNFGIETRNIKSAKHNTSQHTSRPQSSDPNTSHIIHVARERRSGHVSARAGHLHGVATHGLWRVGRRVASLAGRGEAGPDAGAARTRYVYCWLAC